MSQTNDNDTGEKEEEKPTISRRIVRAPKHGNPAIAGVGVAYDSGGRHGERFRIEQLWPPMGDEETGRAEPVYVREDDVLELVKAILSHYEWEVADAE